MSSSVLCAALCVAVLGSGGAAFAQTTTDIWTATLTVGSSTTDTTLLGWSSFADDFDNDDLTDRDFRYADDDWRLTDLTLASTDSKLVLDFFRPATSPSVLNSLVLHIGGDTFDLGQADKKNYPDARFHWVNTGLSWSAGDTYVVKLTETTDANNEPPTLSIDDAAAAIEGQPAEFTARLSAPSGAAVTVSYATVDGTAAAGSDYSAASGTLRFEPGETSQTIAVTTLDDSDSEVDETFTLTLSAASGATIADGTGVGTIADNEPPTLSIDDAAPVTEGEPAEFTARLSKTSATAVSVSYETVDGTAAAGWDYNAASGTLRFEPGETSQTITVTTLDDGDPESDETFTLTLSAASGATIAGGTGMGTITDNEPPTLSIDDAAPVTEGEPAEFAVRLNRTNGAAVSVSYATMDDTAAAGADYTAASGTLRFEPGETSQTITVTTLDDGDSEVDETFTLALSAASGATIAGGTGVGTIIDNEPPTLSIDDAAPVTEGEPAEFTVRLSKTSEAAVSVSYATVDGTAAAGADYTAASGMLRFEPGETTRAVVVTTVVDDLLESAEEFTVELNSPSGATIADASGAGAISDDPARRAELVSQVILPEMGRALAFSAVRCRIDQVVGRRPPPRSRSLASWPDLSFLAEQRPGRRDATGTRQPTLEQAFDGSLFLTQSQEEDSGGRFAAWGCADYQNLSGGGGPGSVNWNGDVSSWQAGADARISPDLLAGVSVSRSRGSFDYHGAGRSREGAAGYEMKLTGLHPYLAWSVSPDLDVWGTAGHAWGRLLIVDEHAGEVHASPTTLDSGMMGVNGRILSRGATTLRLKSEWALAQMDVARAPATFDLATMNMRRLRLGAEVNRKHVYASGVSLTPWGELGLRHDGGDGETGAGLELGGGLRYLNRDAGLTAESYGRWLTARRGTLREWGFGALVRFAPGSGGLGPSVSLMPSWGETASGVRRLWERGASDPLLYDTPGARLEAQFEYGFTPPFEKEGLLSLYGGVSLVHEAARDYRLGGRLAVGRAVSVNLEAERREHVAAMKVHALTLRGTVHLP